MFQVIPFGTLLGIASAVLLTACGPSTPVDPIKRGEYLAAIIACGDCHTRGIILGKPEMDKKFAGGDVGFQMPTGTFFPSNLTPDKETGLGNWSETEIVTAIRTGVRPDGRILAEIMPYKLWFSQLTDEDAMAIAKYLKSLAPISNKVPGPFGPNETPTAAYLSLVMPQAPAAPSGAQPLSAPGEQPSATTPPAEGTPTAPAQPTTPQQ